MQFEVSCRRTMIAKPFTSILGIVALLVSCQGCLVIEVKHPTFSPTEGKSSVEVIGHYRLEPMNVMTEEEVDALDGEETSTAEKNRALLGFLTSKLDGAVLRFQPTAEPVPPGFLLLSIEPSKKEPRRDEKLAKFRTLALVDSFEGGLLLQMPYTRPEGEPNRLVIIKDMKDEAEGESEEDDNHILSNYWPHEQPWDPAKVYSYNVMRLTPVENGYEVRVFDYDFVSSAIKRGDLAGHDPYPDEDLGHAYRVDAEPRAWREFVAKHFDGKLFDPTPVMKLKRIEDQ